MATCLLDEERVARYGTQSEHLREAVRCSVPRVYWYQLIDLDSARAAIEGYHVDEDEYHMGLVTDQGMRKPVFYQLQRVMHESERPHFARAGVPEI